jgi:hypothetical protein
MTRLLLLLAVLACTCAAFADIPIVLHECLGLDWSPELVHRPVDAPPGALFADRMALFSGDTAVPMQACHATTHPDGSLKHADIWFRTGLPADGTVTFVLRPVDKGFAQPKTDLSISTLNQVLTFSNGITAVRLPAGTWQWSEDDLPLATLLGVPLAKDRMPGPLLGVKLPSGTWTAASSLPIAPTFQGYATEILDAGPLVARARVTYRYTDGGSYAVIITLRAGDPVVRVDEEYKKAGSISLDLTTLRAARLQTKIDYRGGMRNDPITYDTPHKVYDLVGWDFYLQDRTSAISFLGGPANDLLAWVAPEDAAAIWLPDPYKQTMTATAEPGGRLHVDGPLADGRRAWGLYVGTGASFPNGGLDLYRWWMRRVVISLDRVVNWQLEWPGMDDIAFPHTYFSAADLPGIRARLQAEPAIKEYMENLRKSDGGYLGWGHAQGASNADPAWKERFARYKAKYRDRGGIAQGPAYISAGYLYYGDCVYLEQLAEKENALIERSPLEYLDYFIKCYYAGIGTFTDSGYMSNMQVSDAMLQRCVAYDLLLGSDLLSRAEKHRLLSKLAFMTYVMHTPEWQPPVHMPDGSQPAGYGQGTPNQKHCAFSCRAMTACMLTNHPQKPDWMRWAMDELRPHYRYTIADSGAMLESPFYTCRDTMRYAPFWSAMSRAGVAEVAPDYQEWMNRPKRAFQYLANMLTPKDPRLGGKRAYHPIGRSNPGVVDPTFMIGADPWGLDDPAHAGLMRWAWEQQGKPSPDIAGSGGGRNIALTLLAFGHPGTALDTCPLRSRRYEGMGAVLRSHPDGDYESNVVFRHDGFCWDLYAVNNGAVYFYGKGAPLLPRFGGYWSHSYGGAWMMDMPFGNRIDFQSGNNNCFGHVTDYASLGGVADFTAGITDDGHWQRSVLFAKDQDRDDPVYLLVRDDVSRPDVPTALHWWVMTKNVAPDGLTKPGVVPMKISHEEWVRNMGHNWENALKAKLQAAPAAPDAAKPETPAAAVPVLTGQLQHFPGMCGVDVDLFIATPTAPKIVTDAASTGKFPYCPYAPDLVETQQLVRIEQPPCTPYLTLITPRWPNAEAPVYRTIAGGAGVAVSRKGVEDRLFLAEKTVTYKDDLVTFTGRGGVLRKGGSVPLRLLVVNGSISAGGITLATAGQATALFDGKTLTVTRDKATPAKLTLSLKWKTVKVVRKVEE